MAVLVRRTWWLAALLLLLPSSSLGVEIEVEVTGVEGELLENVLAHLSLHQDRLREEELSASRIRYLHRQAPSEIVAALEPFGYYKSVVHSALDEEPTGGERWIASYAVKLGPALEVSEVDIAISGEGSREEELRRWKEEYPLHPKDVLDQPLYERQKERLTALANRLGYLDATFERAEIRVDLEHYVAHILLRFDTGPLYRLGSVRFEGSTLREDLLRRYLTFAPGQPYRYPELLELQASLADTPYFERVDVTPRTEKAGDELSIPIEVRLVPAKPQRFSVGGGFGTDTGFRGTIRADLRRLNRAGHHAHADLRLSQRESIASIQYEIPGRRPRTDAVSFSLTHTELETASFTSTTSRVGGAFSHRRGAWRETLSLFAQREDFEVGPDAGEPFLAGPQVSWSRVEADDRIDPSRGWRVRLSARGADDSLLSDVSFLKLRAGSEAIRRLGERHRLIARADIGYLFTGDFRRLPPSARFFTGGDRTVRGFQYQEIGGRDQDGNVIGGESLLVGSLEYELQIVDGWRGALFFDVGSAARRFGQDLERGAGLGARWLSPIGPVRLDVAFALSRDGSPLRLHISVGPDL